MDGFAFGERLRQARKIRGFKQPGLATKIGVTKSSISQWELGITKSIEADNLLKLCKVLRINPYWLVYGTGNIDLTDGELRRGEPISGGEPPASETEKYLLDVMAMCRRLIDEGYYPDTKSSWHALFAEAFELMTRFNYPDLSLLEKLFLNKVGGSQ